MKKHIFYPILFLIFGQVCHSQIVVQGTIKGATDDVPIIGAFVSIKGLDMHTVSELNGNYQIVLPTPSKAQNIFLTVNSLGYREINEVIELLPIDDGETLVRNFALEPDPLTLKEVTVEANKVKENLQDVPIAATVISADNMKKRTVGDPNEAFEFVPNMVFDDLVPTRATISLRGLASDYINVGVENSIGLYIDDVYYSRAGNFNSTLMDIERVEVLRGPQGTLFGKNTIGGVLHIISEDPKMGNSGAVELNAGNFNYLRARIKANTMLVKDKLAVRFAGAYSKMDGWLIDKNPNVQDNNGIDFYGGRLSVLYQPSERFKLLLKGHYSKDNSTLIKTDYQTPIQGDILPISEGENDPTDRRVFQNDDTFGFERDIIGTVGRMELKLDNVHTLTSITSYNNSESSDLADFDNTSIKALERGRDLDINSFSQEIRISTPRENRKFFYIGGFYYLKEHIDNDDFLTAFKGAQPVFEYQRGFPPGALNIIPPDYVETVNSFGRSTATSFAGFLSGSIEVGERIRVNAGGRFTSEKKEVDFWRDDVINWAAFPNGFFNEDLASEADPIRKDTTVNIFSGNIGMEFKTTDNILLYVNYSRGFKGPGYNVTFARVQDAPLFRPEFINSYEFGIKLKMQNRYLFNAAVFVTDFRDKQEAVAAGNSVFIANANAVQGQGVELEFTGVWNKFFKTDVSIGALNMKYTNFPFPDPTSIDPTTLLPTDSFNLSGNRAFKAPDFTFRFAPEFHTTIGKDIKFMLRADYNFVGTVYNDIFNTELIKRKPASRLNARMAFTTRNERFEIALWGKNLTNETYFENGLTFNFGNTVIINPPRTFGVELRANFF